MHIVVKPLMCCIYQYTANRNVFSCLQKLTADCWVSGVVRQQIPHQRACHRESAPGKCTHKQVLADNQFHAREIA